MLLHEALLFKCYLICLKGLAPFTLGEMVAGLSWIFPPLRQAGRSVQTVAPTGDVAFSVAPAWNPGLSDYGACACFPSPPCRVILFRVFYIGMGMGIYILEDSIYHHFRASI